MRRNSLVEGCYTHGFCYLRISKFDCIAKDAIFAIMIGPADKTITFALDPLNVNCILIVTALWDVLKFSRTDY